MQRTATQLKKGIYEYLTPRQRTASVISKAELHILEKFLGKDATIEFLEKKSPSYLENLKRYIGQSKSDNKLETMIEQIIAKKTIDQILSGKHHVFLINKARLLGNSNSDRTLRKRIQNVIEDMIAKRLLAKTVLMEKTRINDYLHFLWDINQEQRITTFMNELKNISPIVYTYYVQQYNRFIQKKGL